MQRLPVSVKLLCASSLFLMSTPVIAQAQVEPPAVDDGTTPYTESFNTGDVAPPPPPEGEPDTSEMDENPIVNPEFSPDDDFGDSLSDSFMFGFTGALEFPHVINVGFETLSHKKYGASLNYGNITRNVSGVDVGMRHADVRLRYHPWGGSFFGGIAIGQHQLIGEKKKDIPISGQKPVPTTVKVTAKANYVAPHIGWFAVWEPGFTIGMDIGWLVPSGVTSSVEVSSTNTPTTPEATAAYEANPEYIKAKDDAEEAAAGYAKKSLPFISMIRVGWMF